MNFEQFKAKYQQTEVEHYPNKVPGGILVSVLVQTYNHEFYIKRCLDAILGQKTNFEFEILLGEDTSSDNTRKICKEYAQKFPEKIRLFLHHPSNKIKVLNVNTGNFNAFYNFYHARGKFVAFCEGDDYWTDPKKLQKQVDFLMKNSDFVLCYHWFEEKFEVQSDSKNQYLEQPEKDLSREELIGLLYHPLLSTTCFRNCLIDLPEEIMEVINVDSFLLSILGNFGKARFLENINASTYRRHSGGVWTENEKEIKLKSKILTFEKLHFFYIQQENTEAQLFIKTRLLNILKANLFCHIKTGDIANTIKVTRKYLKVKNLKSRNFILNF
ncbi:glycosyltransferase family 2 protein [Christiangramia echinicola]|uniref:glycosyltransferase family 2 protein n=1 Tax=Christiangramia echinicola TaxID=279359 RepID=UPI00041FA2C1|nr:glycosyltransferase [Christiangramia echinicola]